MQGLQHTVWVILCPIPGNPGCENRTGEWAVGGIRTDFYSITDNSKKNILDDALLSRNAIAKTSMFFFI